MTSLRISHFTGGTLADSPPEAYYVWAERPSKRPNHGLVSCCLGEFLTRKEAELCFKEYLREIAVQDGSDFIFGPDA